MINRDLREGTPVLTQSQREVMENQRSIISPATFETNLVQDLAWITRQLARKQLPKDLFDSYQIAGNKAERLLWSEIITRCPYI